jgi:hypothetical protein
MYPSSGLSRHFLKSRILDPVFAKNAVVLKEYAESKNLRLLL